MKEQSNKDQQMMDTFFQTCDELTGEVADLSIRLESPDVKRRYEEVRNFRDKHGYPMWSEQWHVLRKRP
jgi:hypothetical protein